MNRRQRPLDSSASSNLADMGWRSTGCVETHRAFARLGCKPMAQPWLHTDCDGCAAMLRGIAGYRPRQAEIRERGNRDRVALLRTSRAHPSSMYDAVVGRSLRSSPRPGKPATWRRETASQQHQWKGGAVALNNDTPWPSVADAKVRVLSIQRKLHQWSKADSDRRFDDLFN